MRKRQTLQKLTTRLKTKKVVEKEKGGKGKKKETCTCKFCEIKGHIKNKCWKKDPTQMPAHIQAAQDKKKSTTKKAGAAVKEEHFLSIMDMCDNVILDTGTSMCMQVNIQDAHVSIPIGSIDYGFKNVIGDEETTAECEDEEEVFEWRANCATKAVQHKVIHEDPNDDVEPPMNI